MIIEKFRRNGRRVAAASALTAVAVGGAAACGGNASPLEQARSAQTAIAERYAGCTITKIAVTKNAPFGSSLNPKETLTVTLQTKQSQEVKDGLKKYAAHDAAVTWNESSYDQSTIDPAIATAPQSDQKNGFISESDSTQFNFYPNLEDQKGYAFEVGIDSEAMSGTSATGTWTETTDRTICGTLTTTGDGQWQIAPGKEPQSNVVADYSSPGSVPQQFLISGQH